MQSDKSGFVCVFDALNSSEAPPQFSQISELIIHFKLKTWPTSLSILGERGKMFIDFVSYFTEYEAGALSLDTNTAAQDSCSSAEDVGVDETQMTSHDTSSDMAGNLQTTVLAGINETQGIETQGPPPQWLLCACWPF